MLKLGSVALDGTPRVAVALRDGVPLERVRAALAEGVDAVELRIDRFSSWDTAFALDEVGRYAGIPTVATIRAGAEGGGWTQPEAARAALYEAVIPQVDAVDIELSSTDILAEVIEAAHASGRLALGSYHNFEQTPALDVLEKIASEGRRRGADIVKVACFCQGPEDLQRWAHFTVDQAEEGVITIGMGPAGMLSRIFFPALGSLLTYTFLGAPTAPGQLNCEDTLKYLGAFYPAFRAKCRDGKG